MRADATVVWKFPAVVVILVLTTIYATCQHRRPIKNVNRYEKC